MQQGDAKNKTKVWQNKNKGAKKTAKSKKKKLTKKKPVTQQQAKGDKAKQANGNVAGNVRNLELSLYIQWDIFTVFGFWWTYIQTYTTIQKIEVT